MGPSHLPPIFSLYKHNYSTYTSVQLPTWKCLAMDTPHMKMIDTSCFFLTHWNCNGKYTRHKTRVARPSRWGCLNSRMGVQFIAVFAFVPSHGCSRQHNRSLRFFHLGVVRSRGHERVMTLRKEYQYTYRASVLRRLGGRSSFGPSRHAVSLLEGGV